MFEIRQVGKTLVNRTQGLSKLFAFYCCINQLTIDNANDALKNRVLDVSLADLNNNQEDSYRKIRLQIHEIQGKNCLTNFYGMDFTSDKLRSLVKKWQVIAIYMNLK